MLCRYPSSHDYSIKRVIALEGDTLEIRDGMTYLNAVSYTHLLTQHEDGWIYGVFCSESKDTTNPDLSAAVAQAGIVRTHDLKNWERLDNLKTLRSPQQRNVVLHRCV